MTLPRQSAAKGIARRGWLEINTQAIARNVQVIQKLIGPSAKIMAVVKSNGYGMGAVPVAEAAKKAGAAYLGVATAREALELEESQVPGPYFLLEPPMSEDLPLIVRRGYIQAMTHPAVAIALSKEGEKQGRQAEVHLNVNVGMNRLGLSAAEVLQEIKGLLALPRLRFSGIFAQFSSAAEKDKTPTLEEFNRFESLLLRLQEMGISFPLRHVANSATVLDLPRFSLSLVRTGILLYGVEPSPRVRREPLISPAISLKATIVHLFKAEKGDSVSYGRTWRVPKSGLLATLPVGTADGIPGELSNCGKVLIRGKRFPIAGRVCMGLTVVYLGSEEAKMGEEAVFLGKEGRDEIRVSDWVEWGKLDPHEILTGLGGKLPKIYS